MGVNDNEEEERHKRVRMRRKKRRETGMKRRMIARKPKAVR